MTSLRSIAAVALWQTLMDETNIKHWFSGRQPSFLSTPSSVLPSFPVGPTVHSFNIVSSMPPFCSFDQLSSVLLLLFFLLYVPYVLFFYTDPAVYFLVRLLLVFLRNLFKVVKKKNYLITFFFFFFLLFHDLL